MSDEHGTTDPNRTARNALRVIGGILAVTGAILAAIGFASFFSAFGGDGTPDRFWLCFVGLPLLSIGGWLLAAGFLGTISRYAAHETAPLWVRIASVVAPRQDPSAASPRPAGGSFCTSCGAASAPAARFCASCGSRVG